MEDNYLFQNHKKDTILPSPPIYPRLRPSTVLHLFYALFSSFKNKKSILHTSPTTATCQLRVLQHNIQTSVLFLLSAAWPLAPSAALGVK